MISETAEKYRKLKEILRSYGKLLIAFSGGVDSSFLLKAAIEVLGRDQVLAVTAFSESLSMDALKESLRIAQELHAVHRLILTDEFSNPDYLKNASNRCYFCKSELFAKVKVIAQEEGFDHIAYGAIVDDEGDFRPGMDAAREREIRSPLRESRLTKEEIRQLSKGLSFAEKPATPCLSSRIPFGDRVTVEKLKQIDRAERVLKDLDFSVVRVRHHNELARIEVSRHEFARMVQPGMIDEITSKFKEIGFRRIALDLGGYQQGSLNPQG